MRDELVDALARLAHELGVAVYGIINVPNTEVELLNVLQERRYAVRYLSSTMTLPLEWDSYSVYLAYLNGNVVASSALMSAGSCARRHRRTGIWQ